METITYSWWNLLPMYFSNEIISIGSFHITFYSLSYFLGFFTSYLFAYQIVKKEKINIKINQLENISTWLFVGMMVGGRLGYVIFYNSDYFIQNPLQIFLPFEFNSGIKFTPISGMSFHGGLVGATLSSSICIYKEKLDYWLTTSLIFSVAPIGYTWGRIGNFVNHELYGRATDSWVGMIFGTGDNVLRHPSQLYEAFFEGIILFIVLRFLIKINKFKIHIMAFYVIGYSFFRFFIEYFREPDKHLGLTKNLMLSRGQILCIIFFNIGLIIWIYRSYQIKSDVKC